MKFRKQMFADELYKTEDKEEEQEKEEKICFIKIPIANEDLIKRVKEVLKLN